MADSLQKKSVIKELLLAAFTLCAYYLKLGSSVLPDYMKSNLLYNSKLFRGLLHIPIAFENVGSISIGVFILLIVFYHFAPQYKGNKVEKIFLYLFSCVSVLALLLCKSYDLTDSWDMVFGSRSALAVALIKTAAFAAFLYYVVSFVAGMNIQLQSKEPCKTQKGGKTIAIYFLIIMICWLPYFILLYPGCFAPDGIDQIAQAVGNRDFCWTANTVVLLDENVILNNHHPVMFTLLMKAVLSLAKRVGYAAAFEGFCIFQAAFMALAFAITLYTMQKHKCKTVYLRISAAFFAFFPLFPIYSMTIVKDSLFCSLTVFTMVQMYEILMSKKPKNIGLTVIRN